MNESYKGQQPESVPTPEPRETEKPSRILAIYRDNPLFQELMPHIADTLATLGKEVRLQTFPEGTPEEEIQRWYEEHKQEHEGRDLLTDSTFERSTGYKVRPILNIDRLTNAATTMVLFGESDMNELWKYEGDIEKTGKGISKVVQSILTRPEQAPEKVIILTEKILDHFFYSKEHKKALETTTSGQEENELRWKFAAEESQWAVATIKDWLVMGGLPEDSISVEERISEKNQAIINQKGNWIISDRHYLGLDTDRDVISNGAHNETYPHNAKLLYLPMVSFYESAQQEGLIPVDHAKLVEEVETILRKKFAPKDEKS